MSKSKGKKQVDITILYGLPGSGKTYFATKTNKSIPVVDLDAIIKTHGTNKFTVLMELGKQVNNKLYNYFNRYSNSVIIDGLITTNAQLRDVIDSLISHLSQYQLVFKLVYWNEDRGACLHNDIGRREVSAEVSIKNFPYEKPNLQLFPEISQKRIHSMKVTKKSPAVIWITSILQSLGQDNFEIKQVVDSMKLKSDSWSLGGTWCSWDDQSGIVKAEEPEDFTLFDKVLEVVCPNITFLKYKALVSSCCKVVHISQSDYYSGHTTEAHHECDVQVLYDSLQKMGFIV